MIGNITVVPVLKTIGLGLGVAVWSCISMLWGWATGTFGLFGLKTNDIPVLLPFIISDDFLAETSFLYYTRSHG